MVRLLMIFVSLLCCTGQSALGGFVFNYNGPDFNLTLGAFTTSDHVFGTVTFDAIGDSTASAVNLSVTGVVGFTINLPSTATPAVTANSFTWSGGIPATWNFSVLQNVRDGSDEEQLTIGSIGDLAAVDTVVAIGSSPSPASPAAVWSISTVPEPSATILGMMAMGGVLWRMRRPGQA